MTDDREDPKPITPSEGVRPEALSNEVLMLKIDDLFQEVESLKRRVAVLEGQPGRKPATPPEGTDPARGMGMMSNPDR